MTFGSSPTDTSVVSFQFINNEKTQTTHLSIKIQHRSPIVSNTFSPQKPVFCIVKWQVSQGSREDCSDEKWPNETYGTPKLPYPSTSKG